MAIRIMVSCSWTQRVFHVALQYPPEQAEAEAKDGGQAAAQDQVVVADLAEGVAEVITDPHCPHHGSFIDLVAGEALGAAILLVSFERFDQGEPVALLLQDGFA